LSHWSVFLETPLRRWNDALLAGLLGTVTRRIQLSVSSPDAGWTGSPDENVGGRVASHSLRANNGLVIRRRAILHAKILVVLDARMLRSRQQADKISEAGDRLSDANRKNLREKEQEFSW
jgi:hypothetical protein